MQLQEDTERTYPGTQLDGRLGTRVIDENMFSAMPKAGLRIFQTNRNNTSVGVRCTIPAFPLSQNEDMHTNWTADIGNEKDIGTLFGY